MCGPVFKAIENPSLSLQDVSSSFPKSEQITWKYYRSLVYINQGLFKEVPCMSFIAAARYNQFNFNRTPRLMSC